MNRLNSIHTLPLVNQRELCLNTDLSRHFKVSSARVRAKNLAPPIFTPIFNFTDIFSNDRIILRSWTYLMYLFGHFRVRKCQPLDNNHRFYAFLVATKTSLSMLERFGNSTYLLFSVQWLKKRAVCVFFLVMSFSIKHHSFNSHANLETGIQCQSPPS